MALEFTIKKVKVFQLVQYELWFRGVLLGYHMSEQMARTQGLRYANKMRS